MAGEEPIIEQPAPAPAADAPAPAPAETPASAPAAAEAPLSPHEVPTLLETLKAPGVEAPKSPEPEKKADPAAKPDAKPVEPEKKVEAKPDAKAEEKPAAKTEEPKAEDAPNPIDWDTYQFKFADNVKPVDEKVAAFKERAREIGMAPEKAQGFVDMFNEAATAFVAEQQQLQNDVWKNTRADWRKEVLAHPVLGGAGHLHSMGVVARARDLATEAISNAAPGSPKYEQAAQRIENFVRVTGAGDHPVFLEILHALGGLLDEPRAPKAIPNPPKNNGVRPSNSLYAPKRQ